MNIEKGSKRWLEVTVTDDEINSGGWIEVNANDDAGVFYVHPSSLKAFPVQKQFEIGDKIEFSDDGKHWDYGKFIGFNGPQSFTYTYARRPLSKEDKLEELLDKYSSVMSEKTRNEFRQCIKGVEAL